ncbi:MAG: hypothetical protein ABI456_01575 [Ktedonobacteraceae bacterium]|nr:hypothetical protein [Chloroflexota bacterium]
MQSSDPKDAIIAFISAPSVTISDVPAPNTQGWRGQRSKGGLGARPETIRFLKERHLPQRQLHYVTFEDEKGMPMHFTCYVIEDDDGTWKVQGAAGGSGRGPQRSAPWANLGGGGGQQFYAGGRVEHSGQEVARVRLLSANGILLEDSVDDDIVLFLADQYIETPLQAELYDRQRVLIGTHQVLSMGRRVP